MPRKTWTDDEWAFVKEARLETSPPVPYAKIGAALGRTASSVSRYCQDHAMQGKHIVNAKRRYNDEQEARILEIIDDCIFRGHTGSSIHRELEIKGYPLSINGVHVRIHKLHSTVVRRYKENVSARRSGTTKRRRARQKAQGFNQYRLLSREELACGQDTRSKSKRQDQGDTEEVQLLLRTAGNAGHGAERHA